MNPPRLPTWLLQRFGVNDSLIGDLAEEFQRGRSTAWFWRQFLGAVVVTSFREIKSHKAQSFRAVVVGWCCVVLFFRFFVRPFAMLDDWLFVTGIVDVRWLWPNALASLLGGLIVCVGVGYVVALFHRMSMLVMFTTALMLWSVVSDMGEWFATIPTTTDFQNLLMPLFLHLVVTPTSILVGGTLASPTLPRRRLVV